MFGRRAPVLSSRPLQALPVGSAGAADWPPALRIDEALAAAIRLFSRALAEEGMDCAGLGLAGPAPSGVSAMLAECVITPGAAGHDFLTLGLTRDFRGFSYEPHCRLFLILNAALIAEEVAAIGHRGLLVGSQLPSPLLDANLMRIWLRYVRPVGEAVASGHAESLASLYRQMRGVMAVIGRQSPAWLARRSDVPARVALWSDGLPATIGRPLAPQVKRINGLPMTDFVEARITEFFAVMQADGLRRQA